MKQKYLLDENSGLKTYSVMSAFISASKPLIEPSANKTDYGFLFSGMGRTRIGEALYKGENPIKYYNSSRTLASQALRRELLIREFFKQAPESFAKRRPDKSWVQKDSALLNRWKAGETGYVLIDAGMRQLAEEGWMPNRVRMLCASFLTKNLGVWWEKGEQHFASRLIDYNIHSNRGNWQWVSGAGFNSLLTDVLSPDLQLIKFDPELKYCRSIIKELKPELKARDLISDRSLYSVPIFIDYSKSKLAYLKSIGA
jgi:deoxyribodipyrimidine photo-lyase